MKITVTQLRNVIRQEVKKAVNEGLMSKSDDLEPYVPQPRDEYDEAEDLERRIQELERLIMIVNPRADSAEISTMIKMITGH